jgi:hypothetical protein
MATTGRPRGRGRPERALSSESPGSAGAGAQGRPVVRQGARRPSVRPQAGRRRRPRPSPPGSGASLETPPSAASSPRASRRWPTRGAAPKRQAFQDRPWAMPWPPRADLPAGGRKPRVITTIGQPSGSPPVKCPSRDDPAIGRAASDAENRRREKPADVAPCRQTEQSCCHNATRARQEGLLRGRTPSRRPVRGVPGSPGRAGRPAAS